MTDFLISLADVKNMKDYTDNPDNYMISLGLTEAQRNAVKKSNLQQIRRYAAIEMRNDSIHARLLDKIYEDWEISVVGHTISPENVLRDDNSDFDLEPHFDIDADHDHSDLDSKGNIPKYYSFLFDLNWYQTKSNELLFVGSGINGCNHLSAETITYISNATKVLYCVADLVIERKILLLNENSEDLYVYYSDDKSRRKTYEQMVARILEVLKTNSLVCVVFYGHPGIFVWPSFAAIEQAKSLGYKARMLPAISSLDCMFADIGFDPSRHSCQIFEATDLLVRSRIPDIFSAVIIFQAGCVGDLGYNSKGYDRRNVPILAKYLSQFYGGDYEILLYEAAQYPICNPKIKLIQIDALSKANLSGITTIYIPPQKFAKRNIEIIKRLGLE